MAKTITPRRGIRNNNPLNIRVSKDAWMGEVPPEKKKDHEFEEFISPLYGLRAASKVLIKYLTVYHLTTINKIIHRWAPPEENDTKAYVAAVCKGSGIGPNDEITPDDIPKIVPPMIRVENAGQQPYADTLIAEAYHMARGVKS